MYPIHNWLSALIQIIQPQNNTFQLLNQCKWHRQQGCRTPPYCFINGSYLYLIHTVFTTLCTNADTHWWALPLYYWSSLKTSALQMLDTAQTKLKQFGRFSMKTLITDKHWAPPSRGDRACKYSALHTSLSFQMINKGYGAKQCACSAKFKRRSLL